MHAEAETTQSGLDFQSALVLMLTMNVFKKISVRKTDRAVNVQM